MKLNHSAQAAAHARNIQHRAVFLWAVMGAVLLGLALLFSNGLIYQALFVPVVFAGVYAAACLVFEIWDELRG